MAPKRSPLDDPPAVSSSEEEGTTSGKEEDVSKGGISSEEEAEEEKVPSSSATDIKVTPKKQNPPMILASSSDSGSGSGSGSEVESDPETEKNVKPIASKPMKETPKRQKLLENADTSVRPSGLPESMVKRWLELIDGSKRAEFDEEWKKLHFAELELFVRRTELVRDQARLMLESYKSSNK